MGVVLERYKIKHGDMTLYFDELCDAWKYADEHGLKRCGRFWEKSSQPYLRGITKGGELVNARPDEE